MTQPTCPDVRNLQALLEAGGSGDEPDEVVRHLETCASCQQTLEILSADLGNWEPIAHGLGQPARREQALRQVVEQLKREEPMPADTGELPFLRPADQPGLLGLLGPYEVQEVIGRGGMGVVLKAFDPALNRVVALKVLAPGLASTPTARWRFVREARAAAAVSHEHVVPVHGVSEAGDLPFLVMQYVAGESLQTRLDRGGPLDVEAVLRIGLQTAEGLAAAHAQGLIHRDIKPANILLSVVSSPLSVARTDNYVQRTMDNGQRTTVKITDFGLARSTTDVGLTQDGVVVGTPEYMAPEQARGEPVDHRADLFSLGSVLYACCTGVPPFRGPSTVAILCQVSERTPTPVRDRNSNVPGWLEALIDRLLAKDPARRFQSAAEVAGLLRGYLAHLGQPETVPAPALAPLLPPVPSGGPARRAGLALRTGGLLLALALAVLGLGGVAWLAAGGGPDTQNQSSPQVFYQNFRDKKSLEDGFFLMGTDWEDYIAHEPGGLRVKLPATRKVVNRPMRGIGLGTNLPAAGDFRITATYELLSAGTPVSGNELAGVDLFIQRGAEGNHQARFGRFNTRQGPVYEMQRRGPNKVLRVPTTETKGQLRLARAGSVLSYLVKDDTTQGEFKELFQTEFGTEPIKFILFEVNPGQEATPVEARLIDLRIESNLPIGDDPPDPSEPPGGAGTQWLVAAAVSGLFVIFGLALAGWFYRRRTAQHEVTREPALLLHFACAGCGKSLKGKPELAGKKVKCPQCGLAVLVPDAQVGQSEPSPGAPLKKGKTLTGRLGVLSLCLLVLVAVILWLTSAPSAGSVAVPSSQEESPKEFFQSLKGPAKDWQRWDLCGPDSNECVRFEPDGVHITLPRGFPGGRPYTGLSTEIEVDGDFEITVHFEFLPDAAGQQAGNQHARFTLDAVPIGPGGINLSRSFEKNGKQFFGTWYSLPDEVTGKPKSDWKGVSTQTMSGRLRLVRKGKVVSFYVAEESQDNFVLIQEYSWSSEPLKEIRLVGWTGGPKGSLNVRICDFRLRADKLPNLLPSVAPTSFGMATVIVLLIIGLGIALGVLIGVWLWGRRKFGT